jgi:hypothetical protein
MKKSRAGELQVLLTRSASEVDRWFESMEPWQSPGPRSLYPGKTLRTLHLAGVIQCQAGIHLVRKPTLAYAAEHHVRALIELVTYAAWIRGEAGLNAPMTPRARAICVELGMANAIAREFQLLQSEGGLLFSPETIENSLYLARHFVQLHAKHHCKCGGNGRGHWNVKSTLIKLAAADPSRLTTANLLYGLWRTYSRSAHHPRLEHLAADAPGGAARTPASVPDRALMLQNLLVPHAFLALAAAAAVQLPVRDIGLSLALLKSEAAGLA